MRKCVYLLNEPELEKVVEVRPPIFFNFMGGHTSSTFSNSCSFLRYGFQKNLSNCHFFVLWILEGR